MDRKHYKQEQPYDSWDKRRASVLPPRRVEPPMRRKTKLPEPTNTLADIASMLAGMQTLEPAEK